MLLLLLLIRRLRRRWWRLSMLVVWRSGCELGSRRSGGYVYYSGP